MNDQERLAHADQLAAQHQYVEAIAAYEALLRDYPGHVDALNNLGVVALQAGDPERSLEAFIQALRIDASQPAIIDNLQVLLRETELARRAQTHLDALLEEEQLSPNVRRQALVLSHLLDAPATYRVAVWNGDITPHLKSGSVELQGYSGAKRHAETALVPLSMQLMLLEDRHGTRLLIVAADLFGFDIEGVARIREIAAEWGMPAEAVVVNASHTHYAPGTVSGLSDVTGRYYQSYVQQIESTIRQVVPQLHDDLQPALLYHGTAEARIGAPAGDAADGDGVYRRTTPFLVVEHVDDLTTTAVVNHACPPVGIGARDVMSAGYPAHLRHLLTHAEVADTVLFLQGAAGGILPATEGASEAARTPEHGAQNARVLATAVVQRLDAPLQPVIGTLFAASERVMLRQPDAMGPLPVDVQYLGLGDAVPVVAFSGEPSAAVARDVIDQTGLSASAFVLGYTNGLTVDDDAHAGDIDEPVRRIVKITSGTWSAGPLVRAVTQMAERWKDDTQPNGYGRAHLMREQGQAFFCLSAGRCGTGTLAAILGSARNARVYHHPRPHLVEEPLAAYDGTIDQVDAFWQARSNMVREAWRAGLVFGETSSNMTPFAPVLADEIPDSKFIVLVRNPWDFVRSGMRQSYYCGHPGDAGRLRPGPDHPDASLWPTMTLFEKVCWLWRETYKRIGETTRQLLEDRVMIVRMEDFRADVGASRTLFRFLQLEGFDEGAVEDVLARPINRQERGYYAHPDSWTDQQHDRLWHWCGEQARHYGYGPRRANSGEPSVDAGAVLRQMEAIAQQLSV